MMKFLSVFLIFILAGMHFYAKDLVQKNREEIFMSSPDFAAHQRFLQKLPANDPIIIAGSTPSLLSLKEKVQKNLADSVSILDAEELKQTQFDPNSLFSLINKNGDQALIITPNVELESNKKQSIFDQVILKAKEIDSDLSFAGVSYINFELDQSSRIIQTFLFPFTFFLCFLGLLILLRNFKVALLIFIPSLLTTGMALALIKFALAQLDMVTSIIPLMTFVLNLTMGLHLALTRLNSADIKDAIFKKKRPILLMVTTTAIGFGSLMTSDIPVIRSFAWISALLILITHLIHILIILPFYDYFFPLSYRIPSFIPKIVSKFQRHKYSLKLSLSVLALLFIAGVYCAGKIPIHTQAAHYFDPAGPITKGQEFIHHHFLGNPNIEILLKVNDYNYESAQKLAVLERQLAQITGDKVISVTALTIEANRHYSGEAKLPTNSFAWATLSSQIPTELKESLLNEEYYKITLLGPLKDTDNYFAFIDNIRSLLIDSGESFELGGLYYTLMLSQKNLIQTLALSFSISLLIMIFLAYLFYPRPKILLCFSFVNLMPLAISLIGLKVLGLSFNVATVMTFSLSLGMIVDGTFHIIHAAVSKDSYEQALVTTFTPIFISSALLAFCFATFAPMDFLPIREFGLALALNSLIGLYFDLSLLPRLLTALGISSQSLIDDSASC